MSGTGYESSDLLTRFNRWTGRPSSGDAISDTDKYSRLADAQAELIDEIAGIYPKSLYGAPAQLTTSDGGYTYTFGTDGQGYPLFPIGKARIFNSLSAIPGCPLTPGIDYLDEGITIRAPYNVPIAGPLYWYGLTPAARLSATQAPVLQPPEGRLIIPVRAAKNFAQEANRNPVLAAQLEAEEKTRFGKLMTLLRTHFKGGGGLGSLLYPWGVGVYAPGWSGQWW